MSASTPLIAATTVGIGLTTVLVRTPYEALIALLTIAPTAGLYCWQGQTAPDQAADLGIMTWIFGLNATVGMAVDLIVTSALSAGFAYLIHGSDFKTYLKETYRTDLGNLTATEIQQRARLAHSWRNFACLAFTTYVAIAPTEEWLLKYTSGAFARWMSKRAGLLAPTAIQAIQYAVAAALGFSTPENILFIISAFKSGESKRRLLVTTLERVVFGSFGHMMMACLTNIRFLKVQTTDFNLSTYMYILGPSMWYHATYDFVLLGVCALQGNLGWCVVSWSHEVAVAD